MANFKCIIPRMGEKDEQKFKMFTEPSMKKIGAQVLQVFDKDLNAPENIFKKYSAGIEALFQAGLDDNDIIIFLHSDVGIIDDLFREKIELLFSDKPDVAILGVAGSTEIKSVGGWWMNTPLIIDNDGNKFGATVGHLIQGKGGVNDGGKPGDGYHLQKGPVGFFDNLVAIDGCMMITRGKFLKEGLKFDIDTFDGNDFYDLDLCMNVLDLGYKVAIADILIYHDSVGMGAVSESWKIAKEKFIDKWINKGYKLPFKADQFKLKDIKSNIIEIEI